MLWQDGRSDEAIFWFNAGRLRGRFDAARCADVSARQGIDVMVMQMPPELLQEQFKDLDKLEATLRKVVAWDEATPYKYDHRWINLHGMGAYMSALDPTRQGSQREMSLPEKEWPVLAKQARENLLSNSARSDQTPQAEAVGDR